MNLSEDTTGKVVPLLSPSKLKDNSLGSSRDVKPLPMMAGGKDDPSLVWSNSPLRLSETRHLPPVFDGHQMDTEDPFLNNMSQQELSMLQDTFSAPTPLPT